MSREQNHLSGNEHILRIQTTPDRRKDVLGANPILKKSWILGIIPSLGLPGFLRISSNQGTFEDDSFSPFGWTCHRSLKGRDVATETMTIP